MLTFAPKFAFIVMLTTLALFLFPATSGSFSSTHGPTTALRAITFLRKLLVSIAAWTALLTGCVWLALVLDQQIELLARSSTTALPLRC